MFSGSRLRQTTISIAAAALLSLVSAGCSSGDDAGTTGASGASGASGGSSEQTGAAGAIDVKLQEYAIIPGAASATAGTVTFDVTNAGPDDVHEFVVIKTDLAPDALPTNKDGTVDEEAAGLEPQGEVEDVAVGDTQSLTLDLSAGNYVFICNIYEDDTHEAHYQEGMRVAFTVE
jgi:uncharacterized cupredoxin-like copper-binding protein